MVALTLFRRFASVSLLVVAVGACGGSGSTDIPPADPTHHVRVEGRVIDLNAQPLGSINVAVAPAASDPLSVVGGTVTDAAGRYAFEITAISSRRSAGTLTVDMYIRGTKYAVSGGRVTTDSVRVTVQLVPMDAPPPTVLATDLRLPQ